MNGIVTLSFTISGGSTDEMNDLASKIVWKAVALARKNDLRIHFTRDQEEEE